MTNTPETPDETLTGPERDLDLLVGTALAVAQDQYAQNGAVMPFAVVLENEKATQRRIEEDDDAPEDGTPPLRLVVVAPDEDVEEVDGGETVEALYDILADEVLELDGAAVVSDVTLLDTDSDALHVAAEHRSGDAIGVLQPYTVGEENIDWGELEPDEVQPRVFG